MPMSYGSFASGLTSQGLQALMSNQTTGFPSNQHSSMHSIPFFPHIDTNKPFSVAPDRIPPTLQSNADMVVSSRPASGPSQSAQIQCSQCHLFHLPSKGCPSLATIKDIRLAIDGVRAFSGGDPATTPRNKGILQNFLKAKLLQKDGANGRPPIQLQQQTQAQPQSHPHPLTASQAPRPQPQQPQPHPPKQVQQMQQPQVRLSAPIEESSSSDSGSGDECGSESGSSESESQEEGDEH